MPHKFNPKDWHILESEWRKSILPVEPLLKKVNDLNKKDVAFDIGAGTGYFTVPLAKVFKKVYAVEISLDMAKILASKGVRNVGIIISDKPPKIEFDIDFVLFADSLHEIDDKEEYIMWVCEKADAVAVIDWRKDSEIGPPKEDRLDEEFVRDLLERCFDVESINVYNHHFFLFGRKDETV